MGIDLAAEPKGTALVAIDWTGGRARIDTVVPSAHDGAILAHVGGVAMIGIDCPLGWPDEFVAFVTRNRDLGITSKDGEGDHWRRSLVNRTTDLACIEHTRARLRRPVRPLSVSADLLGHTAMRAAVLLARLSDAGVEIDRSGTTGQVSDVYPAACLALWHIEPRSYKGPNRARLAEAVDGLLEKCDPWLDVADAGASMRTSDHVFDAVVAALGARAVALGSATEPPQEQLERARREGWIRLPTCALDDLCDARPDPRLGT